MNVRPTEYPMKIENAFYKFCFTINITKRIFTMYVISLLLKKQLLCNFIIQNDRFDISKIPDIYDCIKYDLQHNQKTNTECKPDTE